MIRPPALKNGDLIRVIAPASHFDRGRFDRGTEVLREMGFRVEWREDVFAQRDYLAGDDARRSTELALAFADPETKGIVCARGGYGSPRILPQLDFAALVRTPKVFVGFSDITALLLGFHRAGMVTFHGPMATGWMSSAEGLSAEDRASMMRTLTEAKAPGRVGEGTTFVAGLAEGPLVGGNLAMLTSTIGTPWFPDLSGAILFLEDVGEKPFRLDRMAIHLRNAGVLERVAGVALGRFSNCENPADPATTAENVLREIFVEAGKPCVWGLPFGHDGHNRTIPVGVRGRLAAGRDGRGSLDVIEPAVS